MAAAIVVSASEVSGVSADECSLDSLELARAAEALRTVVVRLQAQLAADRRMILVERAALDAERQAVREDRERAARAVRAAERASAALEQATVVVVAQPGHPAALASERVPPQPRRTPPLVKDASQSDSASFPFQPAVSSTPTSSGTATPSESQANGARPIARCKEPPAHIKRPAVLSVNGATSNASSSGGTPVSAKVTTPHGVNGPKSTLVLHASSQQALAPTASSPDPLATVVLPSAAVVSSVELAPPIEQKGDILLEGFDDADDDIADFDGPPAKSPPQQSPFYRVMPAPKPTEGELAALLPPPAVAFSSVTDEGPVPTKAMPGKCRSVPESYPPSALSAVSLDAASPSQPAHKGRYKAPPAELAHRPANGERLVEAESGALVAATRVKAPPATSRVKAVPAACPVRQGTNEGAKRSEPAQSRTKAFPGGPPVLSA